MNFLNSWLQGIIVAVIITTIIELILPEGNNKKYVKVILGIYVVFNIISPFINRFYNVNSNMEISSIINIDKYTKEIEEYNSSSMNIDINEINNKSIKEVYIENLKNDMKIKLKEKGYNIKDIKLKINNNDTYEIENIKIYLNKEKSVKSVNDENNIMINGVNEINEIKEVRINLNNDTEKENTKEENSGNSNIDEKTKKEVKEYLSDTYLIDKNKIEVY